MTSSTTVSGRYTQRLDGAALPDREQVGGKAWSLARMSALGLRVPPAFVITTDGYRAYDRSGGLPEQLVDEARAGIADLESRTGRGFGHGPSPLLISVRSGAAISMPGMMDTVLNLGMTDDVEAALAAESGDPEFARDTHRRFLELYTDIVLGIDPRDHVSPGAEPAAIRAAVQQDAPTAGWGPDEQLLAAIDAVFRSWNSRRARRYRAHQGIPDDLGTAVTLQAMVFGNLGDESGTGVLFSRNPLDGTPAVFGEYLRQAQGEDVVSGKVTPRPLAELADQAPELHAELLAAARTLEVANREIQDVEFTVQRGTLYLLQSRTAKLAPAAAVRTTLDLVTEGVLSIEEGLARVTPTQAQALVAPRLRDGADAAPAATGESACAGVGVGLVVDDSDEAVRLAAAGRAVVLARPTTSPEDVDGMIAARAIITEEGGSTSHAAVVSRALGVPCVVGCGSGTLSALSGSTVTVDGGAGAVYPRELPVDVPDEMDDAGLVTLIEWARARSPIEVTPTGDGLAPGRLLDLSALTGGNDPEQVADVIRAHAAGRAVTGGAAAAPEAVAAALAAGLPRIVTSPVLPVLLTAVRQAAAATSTNEGSAR